MQHRLTFDRRRHLVHALLFLVIAAAGFYLFLTGLSLAHMANRQSLLTKSSDIQVNVGTLESQYLAATENITPALMKKYGLISPQETHFVTRKPLGVASALRTDL